MYESLISTSYVIACMTPCLNDLNSVLEIEFPFITCSFECGQCLWACPCASEQSMLRCGGFTTFSITLTLHGRKGYENIMYIYVYAENNLYVGD